MLQGLRTILFNMIAILAVWLNEKYGIQLSEELQTALVVTILGAGNIGLRLITKTPAFKKEDGTSSITGKKYLLIPLSVLVISSCTMFKAETPAQRYYALKSEYERLLIVATGYKNDCFESIIHFDCYENVEKIRDIDDSLYLSFENADALVEMGANEDIASAIVPIGTAIQEFSDYLLNIKQE